MQMAVFTITHSPLPLYQANTHPKSHPETICTPNLQLSDQDFYLVQRLHHNQHPILKRNLPCIPGNLIADPKGMVTFQGILIQRVFEAFEGEARDLRGEGEQRHIAPILLFPPEHKPFLHHADAVIFIRHNRFHPLLHCHPKEMEVAQHMVHAGASAPKDVDGSASLPDCRADGKLCVGFILFRLELQNLWLSLPGIPHCPKIVQDFRAYRIKIADNVIRD